MNEAFEKAKSIYGTGVYDDATLEFLFPKLKESEDENIREDLIGGLMWQRDNLGRLGPHDNNLILPGFCLNVGKHLAYLEKQKEQKPAEWSEEDEKIITRLIGYFESFRIASVATKWEGLDIQEVITLLKSLRHSWKPSEEQMEALDYVRQFDYGGHKAALVSLYEQLKAL